MELRVFPTHREAEDAFRAERGVGHYFHQLEVLKNDGTRVKFVSADSLRNSEYLLGYKFNKIEGIEKLPENRRRFFMALLRSSDGGPSAKE